MKQALYPLVAVMVFLVMQVVAGIAMGAMTDAMRSDTLGWAVILSGLVTIAILALLRMIDWKTVLNVKMTGWRTYALAIIGTIPGIFVLNMGEEVLNLTNHMEDMFIGMCHSLIGALSIAVIGPIIEEFIFRESILGHMLRSGMNKWKAITASALIFGIIHLNPAQVPFAAGMGFIFGIIYYKTGNIVITSILHILNNGIAVWQMYSMGETIKEFSMVEWLGGPATAICIAIPCTAVSIYLLMQLWKSPQLHSYPSEQVTDNLQR